MFGSKDTILRHGRNVLHGSGPRTRCNIFFLTTLFILAERTYIRSLLSGCWARKRCECCTWILDTIYAMLPKGMCSCACSTTQHNILSYNIHDYLECLGRSCSLIGCIGVLCDLQKQLQSRCSAHRSRHIRRLRGSARVRSVSNFFLMFRPYAILSLITFPMPVQHIPSVELASTSPGGAIVERAFTGVYFGV